MRGTAVVLALLCVSADAGLFRKLLSPPEGLYRGCFDELRRVLADPSFPKSVNEKLRFDEFTRGLALQNQDNYARWPNMTSLYVVPPSISSPLPSTTVGLAEDIVVPTLDETWPAASQEEANESIAYSESLPFPHTSWHTGQVVQGGGQEGVARRADRDRHKPAAHARAVGRGEVHRPGLRGLRVQGDRAAPCGQGACGGRGRAGCDVRSVPGLHGAV